MRKAPVYKTLLGCCIIFLCSCGQGWRPRPFETQSGSSPSDETFTDNEPYLGPSPEDEVNPTPTPNLLPSRLPGCATMNGPSCEVFDLINEIREENDLPLLQANKECTAQSLFHAYDMIERGFFAHDSPTETMSQRFSRFGVSGSYRGENITSGTNPSRAVSAWMNSPGHARNILNSSYRSSGVGYVVGRFVQCFSSSTPE